MCWFMLLMLIHNFTPAAVLGSNASAPDQTPGTGCAALGAAATVAPFIALRFH
jgi:hypothetical protein